MGFPDKFDEIWSGRDQLEIVEDDPDSLFCRWSQTLHDYSTELVAPLSAQAKPSPERIMQALLRLQRQYFRIRREAPKTHREHFSRRGHICLHPVYEDAYRQLEHLLDLAEDRTLFSGAKPRKTDPKPPLSHTIGVLLSEESPESEG